jgi:hypothetical protein
METLQAHTLSRRVCTKSADACVLGHTCTEAVQTHALSAYLCEDGADVEALGCTCTGAE